MNGLLNFAKQEPVAAFGLVMLLAVAIIAWLNRDIVVAMWYLAAFG
jgi:hypothetical protein